MGAAAVHSASTWARAFDSCSRRASPTRFHRACTPSTGLITTCCETRIRAHQPEPFQHEEPSFTMSSSPSPLPLSSSSSCLTITRDIQHGEIIEHLGTIMVKGNANCGSVIHASGDIVVLGRLEGEAHAGRNGDVHAVIFASHLKSRTLSIANCDAGGSAWSGGHICKVASLSNGKVRVDDALSQDLKFAPSTSGDYAPARTLFTVAKSWLAMDAKSMRRPSKVAAFTGAYIFIVGVALLLFPEPLFGLFFNLRSSVKEWIRVGAVLAVVFGVYYLGTAWGDAKGCNGANSFYMSTIVGRMFIFLSFSWLVASGAGGLPLFVVGTVNLLGALTMLNALRRENMLQRSS